jgi:NAD+ kinase
MKISILSSESIEAKKSAQILLDNYESVSPHNADVLVVLGGDGAMLEMIHCYINEKKPVYGMNCGTVGFLMNTFNQKNLIERINKAQIACLKPLIMCAKNQQGEYHKALAINEISLLRQSSQAAKINISVDRRERLKELVCDGVLVSTPAGSTAYNFSAHGPILPLEANLLALTPISAFRPRQWRGALLTNKSLISLRVNDDKKRPVRAVADFYNVPNIVSITVKEDPNTKIRILFDPEDQLKDNIICEQFTS